MVCLSDSEKLAYSLAIFSNFLKRSTETKIYLNEKLQL